MRPLITFSDLLSRVVPGFFPSSRWKVVRHIDNRSGVPALDELFRFNRTAFEFYQSVQQRDVFRKCEGIFSFLGLPDGKALFIGAYFVEKSYRVRLEDMTEVPSALSHVWRRWVTEQEPTGRHVRYEMRRDPRFQELELRVVVDWGKGVLAWHQWDLEKPVVELREGHELQSCPDYEDVEVSLSKLQFIYNHEQANTSWRDRLSAVGGIYLLSDQRNDKLYVGQANGAEGFWGRWRSYANGSSGNIDVDQAFASGELRFDETTMSVLQVIPKGGASVDYMNQMESAWKRRLRSVNRGYNRNG